MFWVFDSSVGEAFKRRDEAGRLLSFASICSIQAYMCGTRQRGALCQITLRLRLVWLCTLCQHYARWWEIFSMSACTVWTLLDAPRFGVLSKFPAAQQGKDRLEMSKLAVVGRRWFYSARQIWSLLFTFFGWAAPWQPAVCFVPDYLSYFLSLQMASTVATFQSRPARHPRLFWQEALFRLRQSPPVGIEMRRLVREAKGEKESGGMATKLKCYSSATVSHQAWICLLSLSFNALCFGRYLRGSKLQLHNSKQGQDRRSKKNTNHF